MTATYTAQHIMSRNAIRTVIHQPGDAATAQLVDLAQPQGASTPCLPIMQFRRFFAQVTASALTGNGVSAFSIYAATSAAGANATAVVSHAVGSTPDAEGDSLNLECDREQIYECLATATHVGVWLDCANDADEIAVTFMCTEPQFPRAGLTADYVAA